MAVPRLVALALAAVAWGEDMACDTDTEGSCAPSMLEVKKASVRKHEAAHGTDDDTGGEAGDELVAGSASWRAKWGYSSTYCSEAENQDGCWADKPPTTTAECTPYSGNTTCKCGSSFRCDEVRVAEGVTGRCAEFKVYVGGGRTRTHGADFGVTGTSKEMFCARMVLHDQWRQNGLIATTPEKKKKETKWWAPGFWWCPGGYTADTPWYDLFRDGKCHRKKRYLGEECWQAPGEEGTCVGGDRDDVYRTACYEGACSQRAGILNREQCQCSYWGWNLLFACSAKDEGCNGHACVWNTGNGNYYCDYGSGQGWQTILSR